MSVCCFLIGILHLDFLVKHIINDLHLFAKVLKQLNSSWALHHHVAHVFFFKFFFYIYVRSSLSGNMICLSEKFACKRRSSNQRNLFWTNTLSQQWIQERWIRSLWSLQIGKEKESIDDSSSILASPKSPLFSLILDILYSFLCFFLFIYSATSIFFELI